ncbi:MAG: XRE family transcriptional regulator [Oscillatoriales cyanobacterium]|nr:MAG: XRE family transcriptional regulator [Oscillatoriales cyanobacterium]
MIGGEFCGMSVKNCLKPVLEERLKLKKLTSYRFRKLTGLSTGTAERIDDPNWVPSEKVLDIICRTFRIQPGEFLYWVPDASESEN